MEEYYCPTCFNKLERLSGCGTVGYMCNTCKHLVSKQKILSEQDVADTKNHQQNETGSDHGTGGVPD